VVPPEPLLRKFKGPGAYEGLWELLARTYRALADGSALPVSASHVLEVSIGQSARQLAVDRYAWSGAARALEDFYRRILEVGS
jgi:hypothetical protein